MPAGGALKLARQASDVQQDVQLYQNVALELGDVPALQSLLYTHRNVIGDGPTAEEQLASVDSAVRTWQSSREQQLRAEQSTAQTVAARDAAEALEAERVRQQDLESTLARMQQAFESVEMIEKQRAERLEQSVARDRSRKETRRVEEDIIVRDYCDALDTFDLERKARLREIDHADQRGKIEIEETLRRGIVITEEERARVALAHWKADEIERVRILEEAASSLARLVEASTAVHADWQSWAELLASRCGHQTKLMALRGGQQENFQHVERGARAVLQLDELRAIEAIYVEGLQCGVNSPSLRRSIDAQHAELRRQQQQLADAEQQQQVQEQEQAQPDAAAVEPAPKTELDPEEQKHEQQEEAEQPPQADAEMPPASEPQAEADGETAASSTLEGTVAAVGDAEGAE